MTQTRNDPVAGNNGADPINENSASSTPTVYRLNTGLVTSPRSYSKGGRHE